MRLSDDIRPYIASGVILPGDYIELIEETVPLIGPEGNK
jgi:hypothetical protein